MQVQQGWWVGINKLILFYHQSDHLLTLSMLGKNFSKWHFEIFLLFFSVIRFWYFMQTGDSLHEIANLFSWRKKKEKNIISLSSAELAQRLVKAKYLCDFFPFHWDAIIGSADAILKYFSHYVKAIWFYISCQMKQKITPYFWEYMKKCPTFYVF